VVRESQAKHFKGFAKICLCCKGSGRLEKARRLVEGEILGEGGLPLSDFWKKKITRPTMESTQWESDPRVWSGRNLKLTTHLRSLFDSILEVPGPILNTVIGYYEPFAFFISPSRWILIHYIKTCHDRLLPCHSKFI